MQGESIALKDLATAKLGGLRRSEEGFLLMGYYTAEHRRVLPSHRVEADRLCERLARLDRSRHRLEYDRLARELETLPRELIDTYEAPNLVTDVGGKLVLDTILSGSGFTATAIMGLKGSGAAAVGDTQASHAGWLEVGLANAPLYTAPRKTVTFGSASGSGAGSRTKASSGGPYTYGFITTGGTVDGAFMNINGSTTIDNTTGSLFSAGTFVAGSKAVLPGDSLTVTYTLNC